MPRTSLQRVVKKVRVVVDRYNAVFYKKDEHGRWTKFADIGNAGVGDDVVEILSKLGHTIDYEDISEGQY